jgi:transposase-like protein
MKQRRLTKEEKSELIKLYLTGNYTGKMLSEVFPIQTSSINKLLRRYGHKSKTQSELKRKYSIREDFFDNIDSEEKAYILGFLYADGCNSTEQNAVKLSLIEDDKEILEKISSIIQPDKPLYCKTLKKELSGSFINRKNQYSLVITNKRISNRLVELGCIKAKTNKITFPNRYSLPKILHNHFIRGYFDGDGHVSKGKHKKFSIIGTVVFLEEIQNILINELNFKKIKIHNINKNKNVNIGDLTYGGIFQCITFRDWLYKDATIYLKRKKEVFNSYVCNTK